LAHYLSEAHEKPVEVLGGHCFLLSLKTLVHPATDIPEVGFIELARSVL
jgi:hypothetical protein